MFLQYLARPSLMTGILHAGTDYSVGNKRSLALRGAFRGALRSHFCGEGPSQSNGDHQRLHELFTIPRLRYLRLVESALSLAGLPLPPAPGSTLRIKQTEAAVNYGHPRTAAGESRHQLTQSAGSVGMKR